MFEAYNSDGSGQLETVLSWNWFSILTPVSNVILIVTVVSALVCFSKLWNPVWGLFNLVDVRLSSSISAVFWFSIQY